MGTREHRWRCGWSLVTLEDGARPLDRVADPDARWLRVRPELEVFRTVVVPHAVSMMNGLAIEQMPAKQVLCHEYVLEPIRPTRRSRMTRCTHHHIPGLVPGTTTFPVAGSPQRSRSDRLHMAPTSVVSSDRTRTRVLVRTSQNVFS